MDIDSKIEEIRYKITQLTDKNTKMRYMSDYTSLCVLLETLNPEYDSSSLMSFLNRDKTYRQFTILDDITSHNTKQELFENSGVLSRIAYDILSSFGKTINCKDDFKISSEDFNNYINEFLSWLGNDVYGQYKNLRDTGYILISEDFINPCEFCMLTTPNIIVTNDFGYITDCADLAHELGHNYADNLLRPRVNRYYVNNYSEVPSLTFEMLFIMFLKDKKYLTEKQISILQRNFVTRYISCVKSTYILHKLDYLGTYVDNNAYDKVIPFDFDYERLITDVNKFGTNINLKDLTFERDFYTIGLVIASNLSELILDDRDLGRKYFDRFILDSLTMKLSDALKQYSSESVKKLLLSFGSNN